MVKEDRRVGDTSPSGVTIDLRQEEREKRTLNRTRGEVCRFLEVS